MKKLLITGANGYIGQNLVEMALQQGFEVRALVRKNSYLKNQNGLKIFSYDLESKVNDEAFKDVDCIIHLATVTNNKNLTDSQVFDIEAFALNNLFDLAKKFSIKKVIFISSQSATPHAITGYGKSKWKLEEIAKNNSAIIIRPGMVYGKQERALFGLMCKISKLPIVPKFYPKIYIQPIHIDDLCSILLELSINSVINDSFNIASSDQIEITEFLHNIAQYRFYRSFYKIYFPKNCLKIISFLLKKTFLKKFINPQRIDGMLVLEKMQTKNSLERFSTKLISMQEGLRDEVISNQKLQQEGKMMMTYICSVKPREDLFKKYAEALRKSGITKPLAISNFFYKFPSFLKIIDPKSQFLKQSPFKNQDIQKRLKLALLIAESDPKNLDYFILRKSSNILISLFLIAVEVICEIFLRIIFAIFVNPILSSKLKK